MVQLSGKDESCDEVCARFSATQSGTQSEAQSGTRSGTRYVCDNAQMQYVNRCSVLMEHFPCEKGCFSEVGQDLPAYVAFADPRENGVCLFSFDVQPLCQYAMMKTQRMCVCTKEQGRVQYDIQPLVLAASYKEMQQRAVRKAVRNVV